MMTLNTINGGYKMARGVPKGYRHNWAYRGHWQEQKTGKGTWAVDFRATKHRGGSPRGGLPKGSKITWDLRGTQTAVKTGDKKYQTRFRATKTLKSVQVPKRKPKRRIRS